MQEKTRIKWVDFLFEIVDENSDFYGEQFFVEVKESAESKKEARKIAKENFPKSRFRITGPYSSEYAEMVGLDTY